MKKILLLLLIAGGLFSQLEAKCTRSDIANLRAKGFSNTAIGRICGIPHHAKHKKRKKHHARSGGSTVQWLPPVDPRMCKKYFRFATRTKCNTYYKGAKSICRAMGGRLPTLREIQNANRTTHCIQHLHGKTDSYDITRKERDKYDMCLYRLGFNAYLDYWTSTSPKGFPNDACVESIGGIDENGKYYKCTSLEKNRPVARNLVRCVAR